MGLINSLHYTSLVYKLKISLERNSKCEDGAENDSAPAMILSHLT
jgi:hypothetical protein